MKISALTKLSFWYTAILGLTLAAFGFYLYWSLSSELNENIDESLMDIGHAVRKVISLDEFRKSDKVSHFIRDINKANSNQEKKFIGPVLAENEIENQGSEDLLTSLYNNILMDSRNYLIQVQWRKTNEIWRSANLKNDTLPCFFKNSKYTCPDSAFSDNYVGDIQVRIFTLINREAAVSVAYPIGEMEDTLKGLFRILIYAMPLILLISAFGGMYLSRISLRSIDKITKTAKTITARNLSDRLPEPRVKDELGRLIETINEMIDRLEVSFRQIKQFTSDASHELKTPLTILRGELELALHSPRSTEEYEYLIASALNEVQRLSSVVETLLDLSRADMGQLQMNLTVNDLSQHVMDISDDITILAEEKNIKVDSEIENAVMVEYDSGRLHQVLLNLVDNAVKYTPDGGTILIKLEKSDDSAIFTVKDSGMGIPEKDLPLIFDRFYRVDKARSKEIGGTGLGLSIVKWIVDAHDGIIEVDSELKKGSEFRMILPFLHEKKSGKPENNN